MTNKHRQKENYQTSIEFINKQAYNHNLKQTIQVNSSGLKWAQDYTRLYKWAQDCTRLYKWAQDYTRLYKWAQVNIKTNISKHKK
jgi:hypothetical protein